MYDIEYRKKLAKAQRAAIKEYNLLPSTIRKSQKFYNFFLLAVRKFRKENPTPLMSCSRCGKIVPDNCSTDLCGKCEFAWVEGQWCTLDSQTNGNLKYYQS